MKILIIGGGRVGGRLASQLSNEDHDITVVDKNAEVVTAISNSEDVMCIESGAIDFVVHLDKGSDIPDILIACTDSDEVNMITCLLGKKHGVKHTIARVREPEYYAQIPTIKQDIGLSLAINPEQSAALAMSRVLLFPAADNVETFSHGKVELIEFSIKENNPLIGKSLIDIGRDIKGKVLICAISRKDKVFIPTGNDTIELGDSIYVAADHSQIKSFFKHIDAFRTSVKNVIIVGGGQITYYLAERLLKHGMKVKIIEQNMKKCEELAESFPDALIVCADGRDEEVLGEEGIAQADAFVATTGLDEVNTILSVYAKNKGVEKVITKVGQGNYSGMFKNFGVDTIVSPKAVTANRILRYVRAVSASSEKNSIETLTKIVDGNVEALEFKIDSESNYLSKPLRELKLKKSYLVASITRGKHVIVPSGDDTIEIGDSVVVITTNKTTNTFEEIFE